MTSIPYTFGKTRNAAGSFATPFWAHTIGVVTGAVAARRSRTAEVCWLFTATMTTSPSRQSISAGSPTAVTGRVPLPSGQASRSPSACMAARCGPRATSTTSWPASCRFQPITPPMAPAP